MYREGFLDHHEPARAFKSGALNASGNGSAFLGPVAAGYCWYVEAVSYRVANAAVAHVLVEPQDTVTLGTGWDFSGRLDIFTSATDGARNYASGLFVPAGYWLVVSFTGGTQNDVATVTAQIAAHKLTAADYSVGAHVAAEIEIGADEARSEQTGPHGHALPSPGFDRIEGKQL